MNSDSGVLHLTTIPERFDFARDIALGPHCFIGRDDAYPEWREIQFIEAFPNELSLETAEESIRRLIHYLLPRYSEELNALHGTSFSVDFWRILILPWLIEMTQRTWTSFLKQQFIRDQNNQRTLEVAVFHGDQNWGISDTATLLERLLKDFRFNWWIDSEVAMALSPPNWRLKPTNSTSGIVNHPARKSVAMKAGPIRKLLRNIKYSLGYSDILGLRWEAALLAVYVNLLPKQPSRFHFTPAPDYHPTQHFPTAYLNVLDKLLKVTMPVSFLAGFPALLNFASRLPYRPGRLRLGVLSFWNEQEKVIAALAKEKGEKRVVVQHGGEYGMVNYNLMANEVELNSTIFLSWGWSWGSPDDGFVLPLPSPYHSKIANSHKRENDSIILIGQAVRIQLNRFHWSCRSRLPLWYCKDLLAFLGQLNPNVRNHIVFRPYTRAANDIDVGKLALKQFANIPLLEADLNKALLGCRLAVMNTFSTTINYTLAANVPTVAYMPPEIMRPRAEAEPFFEPLRRCGVIHETSEQAAAHIERIWEDVEGWWFSEEVQGARRIWVNKFARTDRFWLWCWMKELARLKNVG